MIRRQDILDRAREWQLRPEVVEKDYVLGWVLAAVAQDEAASSGWILKGGTCVKKCFFETYRFSEDLDFSLTPEAPYGQDEIADALRRIVRRAGDLSGISFREDLVTVRPRVDKASRPTFEGRVGYQGPLAVPTWPRILFDITQHEPIVDQPVFRPVIHPYPDELPAETAVQSYSFEELLAEKTRALYERTRPRDLYDVVYIVDNAADAVAMNHARAVLGQKCGAKGFNTPTVDDLARKIETSEELRADWAHMLAHQLPQLPPIDAFVGRIREVLLWIAEPVLAPSLAAPPSTGQEVTLRSPAPMLWGGSVPLESIRFAGANHLMIEFSYNGKHRLVEPYSLRRARTGNTLLYAWEVSSSQIKAFNIDRIVGLRTTDRSFVPKFAIEISTASAIVSSIPLQVARPRRARRTSGSGPVYLLQCSTCGREFRRKKRSGTLRRHNYPNSSIPCPGRRGFFVGMA